MIIFLTLLVAWIGLSLSLYAAQPASQPLVRVAAIQPNLPRAAHRNKNITSEQRFALLSEQIRSATNNGAQIIVLPEWFYKWWNRYQVEGASGLCDRSYAPHSNPGCWSGEIRQVILNIRDRLMRRRGPRARYHLAGAATIRHELACLGYEPLPSIRTIERVLQQGDRTLPAFRTAPCASSSSYLTTRVMYSNQRHQLDLIGPR